MLFVPINKDDHNIAENATKSFEQQQAELEKFNELKQSYQDAIDCIQNDHLADAGNILMNLYENELFTFRSFDAIQLQKAVIKLILSINCCSSARQLEIAFKGIESFPDEKIFWEHCGCNFFESERFSEAASIYQDLFRIDPFCKSYLIKLISSYKNAFMFEELDSLKHKIIIEGGNWIGIDVKLFEWKSDLNNLVLVSENEKIPIKTVDNMCLPLKDVNWTNYATLLYSMASGNYTSVFKKTPFNSENFAILTGPCHIEISANSQLTQTQSQSLLLTTIGEYSASSVDDLAFPETQKKRSTLRRKEASIRVPNSSQLKSEVVTLPDFLKHFKYLLSCDEQELIALLLKYERPCCELLDKNSDPIVFTDSNSNSSLTTSLIELIKADNENNKPLAFRIFDLVHHFFISSIQHPFPANLSSPMANIIGLFRASAVFSLVNLSEFLGIDSFMIFLLGANEVLVDAELPSFNLNYLELHKERLQQVSSDSLKRFELLKIFSKGIKDNARIEESLFPIMDSLNSTVLYTRYHKILPSSVTKESIKSRIKSFKREHLISAAEAKENFNELNGYFGANEEEILESIKGCDGELKVRLCKIILNGLDDRNDREHEDDGKNAKFHNEIIGIALKELLTIFSSLTLSKFIEYLQFFILFSCSGSSFKSVSSFIISDFTCIFWHIFAKKQLIPNPLTQSLNSLFINILCEIIDRKISIVSPPTSITAFISLIDSFHFLFQWAVQERAFGSLDGQLPLKVFRFISTTIIAIEPSSSDDSSPVSASIFKFAYSVMFSLFKFPNIFTLNEGGIEEWDRSPIGIGTRDAPCPDLSFNDFINLTSLVDHLLKFTSSPSSVSTKTISISDPGLVNFIDWLKIQFSDLITIQVTKVPKFQQVRCSSTFKQFYSFNRQKISDYLNASLLSLKSAGVNNYRFNMNNYDISSLNHLRSLLNVRSDLVYSELQGRKKSFEILKTIRSDLKTSLAIDSTDPEVWKLLGVCYYDAAVHYLSSEAEIITSQSAKLKKMIKKAISALKIGLTLDSASTTSLNEIDLINWTKLSDLIDWSLHEPSKLSLHSTLLCEEVSLLASIGCSCVQVLLPKVLPRDRWIHLLRLELFLRHSGHLQDHRKLLNLLQEASKAAATAYSENVYESTALYMSLVKLYSRLSKLRIKNVISEEYLIVNLKDIQSHLPTCLKSSICNPEEADNSATSKTGDEILLNHLEALNVLDRKKIFHAHLMTLSAHSFHILTRSKQSMPFLDPFTSYLPQIFPFLKQRQQPQKKSSTSNGSLLQIYQSDHERPARYLMAGRRYLLQLLDFFAYIEDIQERIDLLTQFLKKLHYIRKTIIGFPQILSKATMIYFTIATGQQDALIVADELIESLKSTHGGQVPQDILEKYTEFIKNQTVPDQLNQTMPSSQSQPDQ